jgi:hypothetical protein
MTVNPEQLREIHKIHNLMVESMPPEVRKAYDEFRDKVRESIEAGILKH